MADLHPIIDVSRWQGWIDWSALITVHGIHGAWIKCGGADGGHYTDSRWRENQANATAAGMPWGTYFFASPAIGNAQGQAQYAVGIGHGEGTLWPTLDLEYNPYGMTGGQLDDWAAQFCDEVRRLTGRESVLYSGGYFGVGGNPAHPIADVDFWVANYGSNVPSTTPPGFTPYVPAAWQDSGYGAWQFNSTTVYRPGVNDNTVDTNTAKSWLWDQMMGGEPPDEEDDMPQRSVVRTKADSPWAHARLNNPDYHGETYWSIIEGSGAARHLASQAAVDQECFWLGISPGETWVVDDSFMEERYFYEAEDLTGGVGATSATTTVQVAVFAVVLVALLWIGLELGRWADILDATHGQIAALVAGIVVVAALVAAFVRIHGRTIVGRVRRPGPGVDAPEPT